MRTRNWPTPQGTSAEEHEELPIFTEKILFDRKDLSQLMLNRRYPPSAQGNQLTLHDQWLQMLQ